MVTLKRSLVFLLLAFAGIAWMGVIPAWDKGPRNKGKKQSPVFRSFTVQQSSQGVTFSFDGRVFVARGDVQGINSPCVDITIEWMVERGSFVKKGDRVMVFGTERIQRKIPVKELALAVADKQYAMNLLKLEGRRADLEAEKAVLEADLLVVRAAIRSAKRVEQERIALFRETAMLAKRNADAAEREYTAKRELFKLGQISEDDLLEARRAAMIAKAKVAVPVCEWELAKKGVDAVELERLLRMSADCL